MNDKKQAWLGVLLMLVLIVLMLLVCWLDNGGETTRDTPTTIRATVALPPTPTPTPTPSIVYREYDIVAYNVVVNPSGQLIWEKHHALNSAWIADKVVGYSHNSAPAIVLSNPHHNATRSYLNTWRTRLGITNITKATLAQIIELAETQLDLAQVPNSARLGYYLRFKAYISVQGRTTGQDLLEAVEQLIVKYRSAP
jgi:hypothetical protein